MSGFSKIEPFRGVDDEAAKAFAMVPAGGFNLILHDLGKGAALKASSGLAVLDLTDDLNKNVGAAAAALIRTLPKNPGTQAITDALQSARSKVPALGGTTRLLSLSCRHAGSYALSANSGKISAALDVTAVDRLTRTVTFLFLRYVGKDPIRDGQSKGSAHAPTEAKTILASINDIFEPQANVHFDLVSADFLDQSQPFGPTITPKFVDDRNLRDKMDKKADWTVFFVPRFDDGAGFAATLGPSGKTKVPIFVPDDAKSAVIVANVPNPYAMMIAHELGHGLGIPGGGDHPKREGVLGGSHSPHGKEGILIDKVILGLINPPATKAH